MSAHLSSFTESTNRVPGTSTLAPGESARLKNVTINDEVAAAFRAHQAGDLAAAVRGYQAVLARDPAHADTLHLLGVARHQQGQSAAAVELIGKAIALKPGAAAFHANLAEAYRALGQPERAVGCCRAALQLYRDYPEAQINLGMALQELGQLDEAAGAYRAALALRPDDAQANSNLGTVLRTLGSLPEALECFQKAVASRPDLPSAQTNLGQFLIDLGRPDEALPYCQKAVELAPDLAEAHNNLGNAHRAAGRLLEARSCYFEALRINPKLAPAQASLGVTLRQEGRDEEALPWIRQAVELEPNSVDLLTTLAETETEANRRPQAIDCYHKILALEPDRAVAHNALGWLLQEDGQLTSAEECYRAALRAKPDFAPALVSIGGLCEEKGDLDAAEANFRGALEKQPGLPAAMGRLATLLRGKLPEADRLAIEKRLAEADLPLEAVADLNFGLAHVWDAVGEYRRAADSLKTANTLAQDPRHRRYKKYDPDEHERFVDGIIAAFSPELFARLAGTGAGLTTRRPIFIVGMPRSGTTLIEQVLASHSQIHGAGELPFARLDFESIPALANRAETPLACAPDLESCIVRQIAETHEAKLRELDGGRSARVVDKMPDNYLYLGLLTVLFPNALFIHCRRDPRDVAVSCWMTNFRSIRWASDLEHIRRRFQEYDRLMAHWRRALTAPLVEVDYEAAVDDLEPLARRLIAACGLEWEPVCLEFHRTSRPVRTASVSQVRQPLYTRSVGRFNHYQPELGELFAALDPSRT
jgi:tetratricopeptide (TPR) repeat protein